MYDCFSNIVRIAIIFQVPSYWPTLESFYKACVDDTSIDVRIFLLDEPCVECVQMEHAKEFLEENNLDYELFSNDIIKEFSPHVAILQPPYDILYRNKGATSFHLKQLGVRIVYIPYGIEIADTEDAHWNHFFPFTVLNAWRIYTFSELMKMDYDKYCPNRGAVRALGLPRFDYYKRIEEYSKKRNHKKKTVLWKLHFPKIITNGLDRIRVTPELDEYIKFAKKIENYNDLEFIIMPHPMFFSENIDKSLSEKAQLLFEILNKQENVKIDYDSDYRKSFYNVDAIIVDRSALLVEAAFCNVPVLYMKNYEYEEPLTNAIKPIVSSYRQGYSEEDMARFIEMFKNGDLENDIEKISIQRDKYIPLADGYCGKRILNDIKAGIKERSIYSKPRVVLFGTGAVCKYYIDRWGKSEFKKLEIIGLSDNDRKKWGTIQYGFKVYCPEELGSLNFDKIIIMTEQFYMPIKKKLVYELFLPEEKIIRIDHFLEGLIEGSDL